MDWSKGVVSLIDQLPITALAHMDAVSVNRFLLCAELYRSNPPGVPLHGERLESVVLGMDGGAVLKAIENTHWIGKFVTLPDYEERLYVVGLMLPHVDLLLAVDESDTVMTENGRVVVEPTIQRIVRIEDCVLTAV